MSDNMIQEVLDGCLFFSVKRLDRALDKFTEAAFKELGMSHSYALVLFILNQENGKRYKDLSDILCIAPPSLTKIIDKLARREFVAITRDGRTKRVYITDKGREFIPIIGEVFHKTRLEFMRLSQPCDFNNLIDQINHLTKQLK
ncbi:DNA-binding transcriptional regulator, MarR family [Streptococcus equinus]|uniref:DNA-binding transcriptional regulator, MarR family n=1 Tax=Streptococcus equinus TaxID=1335 RepID=A0A1H9BEB7_STREI|nr:MarR family transcriptional regulator [Streptococcus equinus]SDQ22539.1 DNA-binding transcriptional regulator, MarR family [Streptococcus equinus]SEP87352.1 DNA-binding transcriptional regulator, MarR family [Streptococcus equinus]